MTVRSARPMRARAGFTLMEMAVVLSIIGLIMGAIWTAATSAGNARRNNDAATELQTISQNMVALFSGQPMTGFTTKQNITAAMLTAQVVPANYYNPATSGVSTPWPTGYMSIYANTADARTYRLSMYNVPYAGCLALMTQATACQAGQLGCPVRAYTSGGTASLPATGPATNWAAVATMTALQTLCRQNNGGATNSVEFDYSI